MTHVVNPIYINLTELMSGDFKLGRLELSLNKWYEIPTTCDGGYGGEVSGLPILPGQNIQIDLLYNGGIKTLDREIGASKNISFPTQNPVLHSEFLHLVKPGHYRFQTKYPPLNFQPGSLSNAVKFTKKDARARKFQAVVNPKLLNEIVDEGDSLELILHDLLCSIKEKANFRVNQNNDYYNFLARYREIKETGSFSGNCKEISTVTAGFLNALGLRSKIMSAFIYEAVGDQYEATTSHSFSEAYVPLCPKTGFWLLVDPAMGKLYSAEDTSHIYSLQSVMPIFLGSSKSAKIKVSYVGC